MRLVILFLTIFLFTSITPAEGLSKELVSIAAKDTVCKVWVRFKNKPSHQKVQISTRAAARRAKVHFIDNESDLPVSAEYITTIKSYGAILRHIYKWDNAASFIVQSSQLTKIASLSIVKDVSLVGSFYRIEDRKTDILLNKRSTVDDTSLYGKSFYQLNLENIPAAHRYLKEERKFSAPGDGVLIALFDTGFRLSHKSLQNMNHGFIKAKYDFLDNDTSVADPDSVISDPTHPYYKNDEHGSMALSLIAGFDPGNFLGVAWGAQFVLARTENTFWDETKQSETEIHSEEDDWAAAVVWAESLGVDIISSSLGYRDGFQDTALIIDGGVYRRVNDYSYDDLDGKTTIVSRAAQYAVQRGIIVVSAMGNEGADKEGTLCAPADVDGVISVGALSHSGKSVALFSSTGPTSDRRIKPDLVAIGESVLVPDVYGDSSRYVTRSGTSFSTPIIAGICALIMQSMQKKSSDLLKKNLYGSCSFLPGQVTINNIFGRGLPDALKACMDVVNTITSGVQFSVYPNVLKPGESRNVTFAVANSENHTQARVRVLSADGTLVWKKDAIAVSTEPVFATWECKNSSGKSIAPGIYLAILDYKGKIYRRKILIAG